MGNSTDRVPGSNRDAWLGSGIPVLAGIFFAIALGPALAAPQHASPQPTGARNGEVVAGAADISQAGNDLFIEQTTQNAIIEWDSFSIAADESVNFLQPSADSAVLNRVLGNDPSAIYGDLNANGQIFLINRNGVLVGEGGTIDTAGFVASTLDIANQDFMDGGTLRFAGYSQQDIVNLGVIDAGNGDVLLLGRSVSNQGAISAQNGTVALGAGAEILYVPDADSAIVIVAGNEASGIVGVDQGGLIEAAQIELAAAGGSAYELAINQTGTIRATGVAHRDGRILLTAEQGAIAVDGTLVAHDADGSGGTIMIGGGARGRDSDLANAARVEIAEDALLDVDAAATSADGGQVVAWSDEATRMHGTITARGGSAGGDGGFVEVSSHGWLDFDPVSAVDTSATHGAFGTVLLDPASLSIRAAGPDDPANAGGVSVLTTATLESQLASSNVILETDWQAGDSGDGSIVVQDPFAWTAATSLQLLADGGIDIQADITAANGSLQFLLGDASFGLSLPPSGDPFPSAGVLSVAAGATITAKAVAIATNQGAQPALNPMPGEPTIMSRGVDWQGVLDADLLDLSGLALRMPFFDPSAPKPQVDIANSGNRIGELTSSDGAWLAGEINVVNGSGDMTVSGDFADVDGTLSFVSAGGFTLAAGTTVSTAGDNAGDIVLAAATGAFTNLGGSVDAAAGSRYLIYSDDPANTTKGGLTAKSLYDRYFANDAPGTIAVAGDRFVYDLAPILTLTVDDLARLYGGSNPMLAYSISGLVGGDDASAVFSGAPTLSTAATSGADVGDYLIAIAQGGLVLSDYGYGLQLVAGTLQVTPAPLTFAVDDATRRQGLANPVFSGVATGLVNGDLQVDLTGLAIGTTATTASPLGGYAITASGINNPNYAITYIPGNLSITGAITLLIVADDFLRDYGADNPVFTASYSGFEGGDDASIVSGLSFTTEASADSPVGTYDILPFGASATGYEIAYQSGTLTINPVWLTLTAHDANRQYGDANPVFAATATGLVNGDTLTDLTGLGFATTATAQSNVGSYAIVPGMVTNPNYLVDYVSGTLTIDPRPLLVIADDFSISYLDPAPDYTTSFVGLAPFDSVADLPGLVVTGPTENPDAGGYIEQNVGDYALTASDAVNGNYAISYQPGTLTIDPRTVTLRPDDRQRAYGQDSDFAWSVSGAAAAGLLGFDGSGIAIKSPATAGSDVGSYWIIASGDAGPNYEVNFLRGVLTVMPASLTISVGEFFRLYGESNPLFSTSISGLVAGDTLDEAIDGFALVTEATPGSDVGSYAIGYEGTVSPNYALSFDPGTLTIDPATLTVTPTSISRVYGDANPALGYTLDGLVNGDDVSLFSVTLGTAADTFSNVGVYPIESLDWLLDSDNYVAVFAAGSLTITKRSLFVNPVNATREYGEHHSTLNFTVDGLASFDTLDEVMTGASLTTAADPRSNVGDWEIGISHVGFGLKSNNYDFILGTGTLSITPAPLTVFGGNRTSVYGDALPTLNAEILDGLKIAEDAGKLAFVLDAEFDSLTDAGTYLLEFQLDPDDPFSANYYIAEFVGGTLTIGPRPLDITLTDSAGIYGDAHASPFVTGIANVVPGSGFAQSDVVVDDPTDIRTDVGSYQAGVSLLGSPNYTVGSVTGGSIEIGRRLIALKPETFARYYGDSRLDVVVAGNGLAPFHTLADLVTGVQVTDDEGHVFNGAIGTDDFQRLDVGAYLLSLLLTDNQSLLHNYSIVLGRGLLGILPRPITISVVPEDLYSDGSVSDFRDIPLPDFDLDATNLPGFALESLDDKSLAGVFPSLEFSLHAQDPGIVRTAEPMTRADYLALFPASLSDAAFRARYPAIATAADAAITQDESGADVDFSAFNVSFSSYTVTGGTGLLNNESNEPYRDGWVLVSGFDSNPNYVVTAVTPAKIKLINPVEVRRYHEDLIIARELNTGFFNLDPALTPMLIPELLVALNDIDDADLPHFGSERELLLWLSTATAKDMAQHILPVIMDYLVNVLPNRDPALLSDAEKALIAQMEWRMSAERDYMIAQVRRKVDAWNANKEAGKPEDSRFNMANTMPDLNQPPYPDILGEVAGDVIAKQIDTAALAALGGGAAAGAATAAAIAIAGASVIYPAVPTLVAAASGVVVASAAAAALPVAVVIGIGVAATVIVIEQDAQKTAFDNYIGKRGEITAWSDINLDPGDDDMAGQLDKIAMMLAVTGMLNGSMVDVDYYAPPAP